MLKEGADLIKDFKKTPERDRPWAINVIVIVLCIALCTTTFFVFQTQKSEAIQRALSAEAEAKALRITIVSEGKECPGLIRDAVEKNDLKWSAKFDNLQDKYNSDLKARADKWENQIKYFSKETTKLRDNAKTLNKIVKE